VTLGLDEGQAGKRRRLTVDGRVFYASLRRLDTKDINLPPGMESYPSWVPVVAGCTLQVSGRHTDIIHWTSLGDGWHGRVEIEQPPPERRQHPDGHQCGGCRVFDGPSGREMFTKQSHHYANGSLSETEWKINAEAETRGAPPLTEANVGWCWRTKALVARNAPACTEHFVEK
jgi:hypothetical protein